MNEASEGSQLFYHHKIYEEIVDKTVIVISNVHTHIYVHIYIHIYRYLLETKRNSCYFL